MSQSAACYFHLTAGDLTFAGAGDRFQKNLAALRLVHTLESEGRPASDVERLTLAYYTAFGESALLNRLFHYDVSARRYLLASDIQAFHSASGRPT